MASKIISYKKTGNVPTSLKEGRTENTALMADEQSTQALLEESLGSLGATFVPPSHTAHDDAGMILAGDILDVAGWESESEEEEDIGAAMDDNNLSEPRYNRLMSYIASKTLINARVPVI